MKYLCQRCIIRWSNVRNNKRTRALRQSHRVVTIVLRHTHAAHITRTHTWLCAHSRLLPLSRANVFRSAASVYEIRESRIRPIPSSLLSPARATGGERDDHFIPNHCGRASHPILSRILTIRAVPPRN